MKKKKLDLKELELQLPPIDSNETKIILGGNNYGDGSHNIEIDFITDDFIFTAVFRDNVGGDVGDHQVQDEGDLDYYFDDYQNAGGDEDPHEPNSGGTGTSGFNIDLALTSIDNQIHDVYNGLTVTEVTKIGTDSDFATNQVFGHQLTDVLMTNQVIANTIRDIMGLGANIKFDIVSSLTGTNTAIQTVQNGSDIIFQINKDMLDSLGWNANLSDNATTSDDGIDYSALTANQDFVAILMHEVMHAKIDAQLNFAQTHAPNNGYAPDVRDYMLNTMHIDPAIVNTIFTVTQQGTVTVTTYNSAQTQEALQHDWMQSPGANQTITNAVTEFTSDLQNMQQSINHITQSMDYAHTQANSPTPLGGHTSAEWQQIYNQLQINLNGIKASWGGWLNYNGH